MTEASVCVSEEAVSFGGYCGSAVGFGATGGFHSTCFPAGVGLAADTASLAGQEQCHVGHFLRLPDAQYGGTGQDGVGGAKSGSSKLLEEGSGQ